VIPRKRWFELIETALAFLRNQVNEYLKIRSGEATDKLELTYFVEPSGELNITDLGMMLVNVEEDRINSKRAVYRENNQQLQRMNPAVRLNLYVLFAASFGKNYTEALKFISYVIAYFQGKSTFDAQGSPDFPDTIEKLLVELHTLSFEQLNHLWGTLGGKYLPSVMYKVRLLSVETETVVGVTAPITSIEGNLNHRS